MSGAVNLSTLLGSFWKLDMNSKWDHFSIETHKSQVLIHFSPLFTAEVYLKIGYNAKSKRWNLYTRIHYNFRYGSRTIPTHLSPADVLSPSLTHAFLLPHSLRTLLLIWPCGDAAESVQWKNKSFFLIRQLSVGLFPWTVMLRGQNTLLSKVTLSYPSKGIRERQTNTIGKTVFKKRLHD